MTRSRKILLWIIAACIIIGWFNWFVLPDLGVVNLAHETGKGHPIPRDGYVLLGFTNSKIIGYKVVEDIHYRWDGVFEAWPYVGIGFIFGSAIIFIIFDLKKRKFEQRFKDAILHWEHKMAEANHMAYESMHRMSEASKLEEASIQRQCEVAKGRDQVRVQREEVRQLKESCEEKLKKYYSLEKELAKAKSKIRRITEKTEHQRD